MQNYYLFSSKSCPYAHRCEILIHLLNLPINIVYCDSTWTYSNGWMITDANPTPYTNLKEMYSANNLDTKFTSLPVLYDKVSGKILFNDSIKIIRFLCDQEENCSINCNIDNEFYDEFNTKVCVGTYKAGHSKTFDDYNKYFNDVFDYLDKFDKYIYNKPYISDSLSLIDIIVYCHLIRFDLVFYNLFSLNKKHLWQYQNICAYMKHLSSIDGFRNTTNIHEIKKGGYMTENNLPQNLGYTKVPLGNSGIEHYY